MTLQSSGAINASHINVELGRTSTSQFNQNGAAERWLANIATGHIELSDFYGESAVRLVDEATIAGAKGTTSWNMGTCSFGADFSLRRIVVVASGIADDTNSMNIASISVGGITTGGLVTNGSGGQPRTGIGIALRDPTGTTGNITVTQVGGGFSMTVSVFSVAGGSSISTSGSAVGTGTSGTAIASTAVSGGVQFYAISKTSNNNVTSDSIAISGITQRINRGHGAGDHCGQLSIGWDNKTAAGSRSFNWSGSSNTAAYAHAYLHLT